MQHDDMPRYDDEASENDWLDVKFVQSRNADEEQTKESLKDKFRTAGAKIKGVFSKRQDRPAKTSGQSGFAGTFKRVWKPVAAVAVVALVLLGMRYVDSGFVGDVFGYAKETYTSNMGGTAPVVQENVIVLPSNSAVTVEDGNLVFTGGTLVTSLIDGVVTDIAESAVTVTAENGLETVFSGLSEIMVNVGDNLSQYQVVGKYDEACSVGLLVDGGKVSGIYADGYTLKWQI